MTEKNGELPPPEPVQPKLSVSQEEEEVLRELCACNGINYVRLSSDGSACRKLESFFCGIPSLQGLSNFPNLQVLCIIGEPQVSSMDALSCCTMLKELWVAECQIKRISGLESLKHLRKLFLYSNMISEIEGLDHLTDLEVVWLNDNRISTLEGLSHLEYLRDLNLAENEIDQIGNSLSGLVSLEKLELSGNPIHSFKDLTNLAKLGNLRELGLKSPNYPPSAVGNLCNCATHILYHIPKIFRLDTYDISSKVIKDLAETTVTKKKMFYNMKVNSVRRNYARMQKRLEVLKKELQAMPCERLRALHKAIKELEGEEREKDNPGSGTESEKEDFNSQLYEEKIKALLERCQKWEKAVAEFDRYYQECSDRLHTMSLMKEKRLICELETGGNVRFEEGKPSDIWFTSCHDLVLSRFCASDYRELFVTGVKIHRITRVHNRILKTRFDDTLEYHIEEEENGYIQQPTNIRPSAYKKQVEYLFWVWDPEQPGGSTEYDNILEDGFMDPFCYEQPGKDTAVHFTNSMYAADKLRIQQTKKQSSVSDSCPFRHGQLIVAKVFTGHSVQCNDHKRIIDKDHWPKADSVFRPKSEGLIEKPVGDVANHCDCSHRQCDWYIFDNKLVVPEYVIEFEYITRFKPKSPFAVLTEAMLDSSDYKQLCQPEELPNDEDLLNSAPFVRARARLVTLTEEILLKTARTSSLSSIVTLNLHDNGLTKLKYLQHLPALKKLIISFNEMTRLDELSNMNLEYIDASFNKLTTLEGFKNLAKLKHLDVSWNRLQNTRDDISILRKHAPMLSYLRVTHNKWQKADGLRLRAIGRIKSLTMLNDEPVTETEAAAALRMAAGSRISQVSLLTHSRTDTVAPRTLSLKPVSHVLMTHSRNKLDRLVDQDNLWYTKVTTLNLDNQHISKLSNLERMENLRWVSFNNNDLTRIEGLDSCINLEELCLENNCISKLEGLSKLTKLKRLYLGHNNLLSVDGLDKLHCLELLSLEGNRLQSLVGIQRAPALSELYLANNSVENLREVFCLKALSNLFIVDLFGNPIVSSAENYRLFVVFHLKSLRALDGLIVETAECSQAKETFGGRLTEDFVADRLGHANFTEIRELDLPSSGIRTVELGSSDSFNNLRSINLEHNNMSSLSGLIHLVHLQVLCLNHNHIECLFPRPRVPVAGGTVRTGAKVMSTASSYSLPPTTGSDAILPPVLEKLEVLHLAYNNIKDMAALQLSRIPSLKALFLQGNEITRVEGLEGLHHLQELVLDRNKIKALTEFSFVQQWNLKELHIEENRIKDLNNFSCLESLQRLFLGSNRIQDLLELDKLTMLSHLVELSVINNSIARRMLHRSMLIYRMPHLVVIDGIPVTDDERTKALYTFIEQQAPPITTTVESTLPGIGPYKTQIPVKVTNMQLVSSPYFDKTWGGTIHLSEEAMQEVQRGGGRRRGRAEGQGNTKPQNGAMLGSVSLTGGGQTSLTGAARAQHSTSQVPYVPQGYSDNVTDNSNRSNKPQRR